MAYRDRTVKSKNIIEKTVFHTPTCQSKRKSRGKKLNTTTETQQKINLKRSAEKLRLTFDENFIAGDYFITLTQEGNPTPEEAKKNYNRFMRDVREAYKAEGKKAKYVTITEAGGKIHHHILINRISAVGIAEIKKMWGGGFVKIKLFGGTPKDCVNLANYYTKRTQKNVKGFSRGWSPSKGLKQPEPPVTKIARADTWREPPKPIKGYYVDTVEVGQTQMGYPFMFYRMIKLPEVGGDRQERKKQSGG